MTYLDTDLQFWKLVCNHLESCTLAPQKTLSKVIKVEKRV